jgi:NAD(P)-dependent dehydrogenase (short-subunit alcohol dehydrogenase family)
LFLIIKLLIGTSSSGTAAIVDHCSVLQYSCSAARKQPVKHRQDGDIYTVVPADRGGMAAQLSGQRALVTGAARGIGRAIATAFSDAGARVGLLDRNADAVEEVAATLDAETVALACDVRETNMVNRSVARVREAFGGLDVAVNNAGVIDHTRLVDASDEDIDDVLDINLHGVMRVARATLPALADREGTLINVTSQLSEVAIPEAPAYCASKGGANNLTRQLAIDHADDGVTVNGLAPGIVATEMTAEARNDEEWRSNRLDRIPLGRFAEPEDIADPAVFLASDAARYMTGHVLVVDGGYVAR